MPATSAKIGADFFVGTGGLNDLAKELNKLLSKSAREWSDDVKQKTATGMALGFQLALSSGKTGGAMKAFVKSNIVDVHGKFMKEFNAKNFEAAEKMERILDRRVRSFEREAQAQVDALEAVNKSSARTFEERADDARDQVQKLQGMLLAPDPGALLAGGRGVAGMLQQRGRAREERARGIREEDPAQGRKMAMTGKAMAGVGGALVTIAAVAGAVLALIKLFISMNDRIVDMNKSILQTGSVADMGIRGKAYSAAHEFDQELAKMREEILDAADDLDGFRVSSEEMFRALGGLNEANYRWKDLREEIAKGSANVKSYSDATEIAITYSKLFGVDLQTSAQNMGALANQYGTSLEEIAEGLSAVNREAQLSGFTMKRFYSTIIEATSGMGFYAIRLEEAGKMLKFLSNMMGETAGAELFKSLANTWTEASTEARLEEILTTGQANMARIFKDVAEAEAQVLYADLTSNLADKELWENAGYASGAALTERLGKMNDEQREALMARLKAPKERGGLGYEPEIAQRMDNLIAMLRAGEGDRRAMVEAIGTLGPAGTLATLLQSQIFGQDKMIHEFVQERGVGGRAAAEKLTGITGQKLENLIKTSRSVSGDLKLLQKLSTEVQKGDKKISAKETAQMAELYGAVVSQTGEIRQATYDARRGEVYLGKTIEKPIDLILAQNDKYAEAEEAAVSEDIELARRIAKNTEKLANVMEATMMKWLNRIWDTLNDFWKDWKTWWKKEDPGVQGRVGAENRLMSVRMRAARATEQNSERIKMAQEAMKKAEDPVKKEALEKSIESLTYANTQLESTMTRAELGTDLLREMQTDGMTQNKILEELAGEMKKKGAAAPTFMGGGAGELQATFKETRLGGKHYEAIFEKFAGSGRDLEAAAKKLANIYTAFGTGLTTGDQKVALTDAMVAAAQKTGDVTDIREFLKVMEETAEKEINAFGYKFDEVKNVQRDMHDELTEINMTARRETQTTKDIKILEATRATDLILPAGGGKPVMLDAADTVFAASPGGPIAQAVGGGGGGTVNVNVYGGDQKKVYETVMRALKATGNA